MQEKIRFIPEVLLERTVNMLANAVHGVPFREVSAVVEMLRRLPIMEPPADPPKLPPDKPQDGEQEPVPEE